VSHKRNLGYTLSKTVKLGPSLTVSSWAHLVCLTAYLSFAIEFLPIRSFGRFRSIEMLQLL